MLCISQSIQKQHAFCFKGGMLVEFPASAFMPHDDSSHLLNHMLGVGAEPESRPMSDFFKGWRRKLGLVTLVMACVMSIGWVRSFYVEDTILVHWGTESIFTILSEHGSASWCSSERVVRSAKGTPYITWTSRKAEEDISLLGLGLGFGTSSGKYEMHYLSVVIPVTLLSAYLLLSKLRPAKKPPEST